MKIKIKKSVIELLKGDITNESTDAIVNAANQFLVGGGGVDGAIHKAGGPSIMQECQKIGSCPPGHSVITTAGNLKAKNVIHTVGPIYYGGTKNEAEILKSAYLESLKLASAKKLKSISFPAISTGIYGYPIHEAAHIALKTTIKYLEKNRIIEHVRFILFEQKTYNIFIEELIKLQQ